MENKKMRKLSTKIALIASVMMVIIFAVLITITVITTKKEIQTSSFAELQMLSGMNATDIQQIMDKAQSASSDITFYMQNSTANHQIMDKALVDTTVAEAKYRSQIYPTLTYNTFDMKVEDYLISTLKSLTANSDDIVSSGILFEPYLMSKDLKSFTLYATADGKVSTFGEYDEYSLAAYYKDALEQKKVVYTDPYIMDNMNLVTVATPVILNDKVIGVVIVNVDIHRFDKINSTSAQYPSMYTAILKDNGVIIYESSGLDYVGTNTFEYMSDPDFITETKNGMASGLAFYTTNVNSTNDKVYKFYDPINTGDTFWYSMTAVNVADVNLSANRTALLLLVISVAALVIMILVIISVLKKMLNPINRVVEVANRIAQGDLSVSIEATSNDEIGMLAQAFQLTITSLKEMIGGISYILNEVASNNLTVSMDIEFKGDFAQLGTSLKRILSDLNSIISNINITSDQVANGSDQVSSGAQALSQGATEQASAVEELAATITNISDQVQDNATNAIEASHKAGQVGTEIVESNNQMQNMIVAMHEISDSSSQIGKIIKTIEDIAFQTNILALNAAVEAARAGAAGKGFAVVADEVRNLASKSADAAKLTTALIEGSILSVGKGTKIADDTAKSLSSVVASAQQVADIVDLISGASKSQADSITQVTLGIDQIASVVQTNSATAEESAAASEQLSAQAQLLKSLIGKFRLQR